MKELYELYIKVDGILNKVDFSRIWPGFAKFPFALYDADYVYFQNEVIPYDRRFLGNTSIEYDNEFIAIWNVTNPATEDPEILAADLVHEMFHAFQREKHESRFPNDLLLLDYPDDEENFVVKYSEHLLLAKAFLSSDKYEKTEFIKRFIAARKYRESLIGDIIKQEYLSETIEGMAEYAGSMALKQISGNKYAKRTGGYIENLQALDGRFFDIRRMLYYTGAIFCLLLQEVGIDFQHTIGDTEIPLFTIAAGNIVSIKPDTPFEVSALSQQIAQYRTDKKWKFDEFLLSHHEEITEDFFICGYDPMNMIKMDGMILCRHFIMLKKGGNDAPVFIQGPVMVEMKHGSVNEVMSYIK